MKTRYGFVTNSSSSSFIVINSDRMIPKGFAKGSTLIVGEFGKTEFGWERTRYTDMHTKINFAWLQILYAELCIHHTFPVEEWKKMFFDALTDYAGFTSIQTSLNLYWKEEESPYKGYIDHSSSATEFRNTEIFASTETLCMFLFGAHSYIQGDNDN
jgi:hypothetical protein